MKNIRFFLLLSISIIVFNSVKIYGGIGEGFHFTENKGQHDSHVKYHVKLNGGNMFLEVDRFTFDIFSSFDLNRISDLKKFGIQSEGGRDANPIAISDRNYSKGVEVRKHAYSMIFDGANLNNKVSSVSAISGYKNYFIGNDKSKWVSNVKSFKEVNYSDIYSGIDIKIYSMVKYLKYDFIVKPKADPNQIQIRYDGVDGLSINERGDLVVALSVGEVKEAKLSAYQTINGKQKTVECKFNIGENNVVSFDFPKGYDDNYELVIDPVWVFSTLTGSTADNWGFTSTYDSQGNLYAAGIAFGTGYPTSVGAYDATYGGGTDKFDISITKFTADGTNIIYSTYLGGNDCDTPSSLVNDSQDNLFLLGCTSSSNFPATSGAYDNSFNGGFANTAANMWDYEFTNGTDIIIAKFNAAGSLTGSTFIGGTDNEGLNESLVYNYADQGRGEIVLDENDNVFVCTSLWSDDFPVTNGSVMNSGDGFGEQDAVVFKMNNALSSLLWATYVGGSDADAGYSIRYSGNGNVFVCGGTLSTNIGTTAGVVGPTLKGGWDGYLMSFNATTGAKLAATYLGTTSYDQAFICETDDFGNAYVVGQSRGAYPIANATYSNADGKQFIHKLNSTLSTTAYSTVFGSGSTRINISPTAFLVDVCGNVYVTGWGGDANAAFNFHPWDPQALGNVNGMPVTADAHQSTTDGSDFYFFVMERDANSLLYATYFGDNGTAEHTDGGTSRFDPNGIVYQSVCASCGSTGDFPTTPGVWAENDLAGSGCNMGAIKFEMNFLGVQAQAEDPGDITLCATPYNVDFNAGTNPPPYNFWDFGDGSGTSTLPNPTYTFADTGSYTIMYIAIDSTTCNIRDTAYFDVTLIRPAQFNAQFNVPPVNPCDGMDSLLVSVAFTGSGADSLVWDMGNGDVFSDSLSLDYYYTSQGIYTLEMTAYDLVCNLQQSFTETINNVASFSYANAVAPPDTSFCGPPPYDLDFTASSVTPHHFWNFGDGSGTSTQPNPSYTYVAPGNYDIMYVAIDSSTCNIADTVYFNVDITQAEALSASFNLPVVEPCTSPDSIEVNLAFTGTGADSLSWNMGNGDIFSDSLSLDYYYTNQGTYTITMSAWDFQCNEFAQFTDVVDFNLSYTAATADVPDDIFLCASPLNVDFSAGSTPPPNSYWDFGDGIGNSNQTNPTYTYAAPGDYQVMYVAIDSSTCNIADTVYFDVTLAQAESFSASLNFVPPPPCGNDSLIVDLAFTGTGADSIIWDMGNGDVFNSTSVNYAYTVPGTYTVSMTAYDNVCNHVQTISEIVNFAGEVISMADVPNVFTPNGDGENDILKIMNIDANADFRMTIYNRWGKKVFESETNGDFWDGSSRLGGESHAGVYFYEVIYRDICTDEDKVETGFVHLMRE